MENHNEVERCKYTQDMFGEELRQIDDLINNDKDLETPDFNPYCLKHRYLTDEFEYHIKTRVLDSWKHLTGDADDIKHRLDKRVRFLIDEDQFKNRKELCTCEVSND